MLSDHGLVNFCAMEEPNQPKEGLEVSDAEREGLERMARFNNTGRGYAMLHATRPSTMSSILMSNPIALLAWYVSIQYSLT